MTVEANLSRGTWKVTRCELPPPFGWFAVARSEELAKGEVKTIELCGGEFALWRGDDGKARMVDAICPHLGAHLGHSSQVMGNDLRCAFHHWAFAGDGSVTDIPYAKLVPPKLTKPCERGRAVYEDAAMGMIFAWWHPHGVEPLFKMEPVEEIAEQGWVAVNYKEWEIPVHPQEITENSADIAHFPAIHGFPAPPLPQIIEEGYLRRSEVSSKMKTSRGTVDAKITVRALGPGVSFTRFWGVTDMLMLQMQTPVDLGRTLLRHLHFTPKVLDADKVNVTKKLIANTTIELENDAKIWPSKRHLPQPLLVDGDGPILDYRKWYSRFYA